MLVQQGERLFLKLGGSLLTDKTKPQSLRADLLANLVAEIAAALAARPGIQLLLGHGSGSFGHVTARRFGTREGVSTAEQWRGFAETGRAAAQLNRLVVDTLWAGGVPALSIQPSASARCCDGRLAALDHRPIQEALEHGLTPVIYGDVCFDEVRGGTIASTEELFAWLAPLLQPRRILLLGDVSGVMTSNPAGSEPGETIPVIRPGDLPALQGVLGGSRGVDVTGGMLAKVMEMAALVTSSPGLAVVHILSGLESGLLHAALLNPEITVGTRILPS